MDRPLPWTDGLWTRLQAARREGRLAHALLLTGPLGVGKRRFAGLLAQSLLCRQVGPDGMPCGHCGDCQLMRAGTHPDLVRVGPDPDSKSGEISVAVIRDFTERESLTPSRAPWKVALIDPADRLNPAAANALLKTLEEPAGQTLLCLIGERPGALPATIRSRCVLLKMPTPDEPQALAWLREQTGRDGWQLRLRLAHGAPLRAIDGFDDAWLEQRNERLSGLLAVAAGTQDPIAEAAQLNAAGATTALEWLVSWICDLVRLMATPEPGRLENPDRQADLAALAARIEPAAAHRLLKRVLEGRALVDTNVNHQLLLESLIIDWSRICRGQFQRRY